MKTQSKSLLKNGLTQWGIVAAVLALPLGLMAAPDAREKSVESFAEQLSSDLKDNQEALRGLVRRAMENGGKLELDVEEFEKLMGKPLISGAEGVQQTADDEEEAQPSPGEAMRGFMNLFQRQMRNRRVGENEKEHEAVLGEYRPVVDEVRMSTVALVAGKKRVAYGTVVDSSGYVVTKASEVVDRDLRCMFPGGVRVSAEVVDVYEPLDLALVKVGAEGLEKVKWADGEIELGSFLAASGVGEDPIAIGVASVAPRSLSEKTKGFLGVTPEGGDDGVVLARVIDGMPAAKAGLLAGDVVLAIDGEKVESRVDFHRMIAGRSPGEKVKFKVKRGEDEKDFTAELVSREALTALNGGAAAPSNPRVDRMNMMGGDLSKTRDGFVSALQTDLTLDPSECGGPLVNLDGEVVGVNIARSGRVNSYAVPAKDLRALLGDLESGKFTVQNLTELRAAATAAEEALQKAEAALKAAMEAKKMADQALKKAKG